MMVVASDLKEPRLNRHTGIIETGLEFLAEAIQMAETSSR